MSTTSTNQIVVTQPLPAAEEGWEAAREVKTQNLEMDQRSVCVRRKLKSILDAEWVGSE